MPCSSPRPTPRSLPRPTALVVLLEFTVSRLGDVLSLLGLVLPSRERIPLRMV